MSFHLEQIAELRATHLPQPWVNSISAALEMAASEGEELAAETTLAVIIKLAKALQEIAAAPNEGELMRLVANIDNVLAWPT